MQTCIVNCSVFVAIWPIFSIILQKKETNWCSYFEPIGSEEIYITWIALEHVAYLFRGFFFTEKHSDSMWVFFVIFWCCDHGVNFHSEYMEYYLIMLLHCSMITWLFILTLHILFSVTSLNDQIRINLLILFCWVFFSLKLVAILPRAALPVPVFPILQPALGTSDQVHCMDWHQSFKGSTDLQGVNLQEISLCHH